MMKMKKVVIALSISVMSAAGMALAAAPASPVYSENGDYPAAVVPYAQKAHTMGPVSHTYSENGDYLAAVVPEKCCIPIQKIGIIQQLRHGSAPFMWKWERELT